MEETEKKIFIVDTLSEGTRLDRFLALQMPELSRSFLQRQLKNGMVTLDGRKAKSGEKVKSGMEVCLVVVPPEELTALPENIPLQILYEDEDIIVIDKPKQMVVHPAAGHTSGTVVNALLYHCKDSLSGINGVLRPGIVHRIDQDTTGVIVACKNDMAHRELAEQFRAHTITRRYHAIVYGAFQKNSGTVEGAIGRHPVDRKKMAVNVRGGKQAVTHYQVLDELDRRYSYISCCLETGRTHQIRVHMASIGHPVLGDNIYGPKKCPFSLTGQTLHAMVLGFTHPRTQKYMEFEAPLPAYFEKLLQQLGAK